ncbi:outer membrane beta-barrel protein [Chitinimonas sp.]|uniref:outer membrane beta-barrel protein n=1 Tax=Chitinimonas sp. TaxID=1934313 RepID=UPI0035B16CF3
MKTSFALLAAVAAFTLPASAGDFYVGADVGRSKLDVDTGLGSSDSKATSWALFAGYQLNPNWGFEAGVRDFGDVKASRPMSLLDAISWAKGGGSNTQAKVSASALQLSTVGTLPINDSLSLYGRLGLASVKVKSELRSGGFALDDSSTKTKALIGVGARYALSPQFGVRAEYANYGKVADTRLSSLTVGADYRF